MRVRLWLLLLGLSVLPAAADEEFAASFRLRGGYDSNPLLAPQGKGAQLAAVDAAAAYGRDFGEWIAGATFEGAAVRYGEAEFTPLQNYRLRLRLANKSQNDLALDATTTLTHFSNYDTKSESVNQRVHAQWVRTAWRPFVAGDLRFASLNEANVLIGDFLPEPMRYLRGTITPGVAYVKDKAEAGVLLALARTKYAEELDLFGFRRDNDRVQPGLYAKFAGEEFALAGAVSFLHVRAQDEFFTDVNEVLFEASLNRRWNGWSADFAIARTAEDTTFPVSPVTINTLMQAKLMRDLSDKTAAGVFSRVLQRKYWDSPFYSRLRVAGIEVTHAIAEDVSLAAEIGLAKAVLLSGAEAGGVIATLALTKRFSAAAKK